MNIIERIEKWQKERLLDQQEFDAINEFANLYEEILEMNGIKLKKTYRDVLKTECANTIEVFKSNKEHPMYDVVEPTDEERCDALCDIIVFAVGGLMKLGYDPKCALDETLKEIESRTGKIVDGKFQKDDSEEARKKWYKANYNKCKKDEK